MGRLVKTLQLVAGGIFILMGNQMNGRIADGLNG
jgi:hypothetical protein